jgi:hypothetical protein
MSVGAFLTAFTAPVPRADFDASVLGDTCLSIADTYQTPSEQIDQDLDALAKAYVLRERLGDWSGATEADAARLMRAACAGRLEAFERLRDFFLVQASRTDRQNLLAALCEGDLEGWVPGAPLTGAVAQVIVKQARWLPTPYASVMHALPEILDAETGADRLAKRLIGQVAPYQWLLDRSVPDPHALGFFMRVSEAFLEGLPAVQDRTAMDRLMDWVRPDGVLGVQGDQQITAINQLLRPWTASTPKKTDQINVTDFLLKHFGDPRIEGAHVWKHVNPSCRRVLLRWLAGDSITAFMEVISAVEVDKPDTWRQRREFWTHLYDEGTVSEAWVALHPTAQEEAQRRFERTGNAALKGFGQQSGGRRDTSLLIMRAGDKIIVEGSHTYRVHIFRDGALGCPQLYLSAYFDERITLEKNHPDTRTHDIHGRWRDWVRSRLQ